MQQDRISSYFAGGIEPLKIVLIVVIALILIFVLYFFVGNTKPSSVEWGITFSKKYAIDLGLDWQEVFSVLLYDLGVKRIRLIAYWDDIEKEKGEYDFSDLDWQMKNVEHKGIETILAVGRRLPRWPECFVPEWAKSLSEQEKQEHILSFVSKTVNRYKNYENIIIWQVENEPFLGFFGDCPKVDRKFLEKEVALVKELDDRPVMITESGEFSTWIGGARRADIIGTSLYRKIYGRLKFYFTYPIPPVFYQRKAFLIKSLFKVDEIIAIEVQAEPWGHKPMQEMTVEEQDISMSFEQFNKVLKYTAKAGFSKAYLWGAEWWYWRMINFQDNSFWNKARSILH